MYLCIAPLSRFYYPETRRFINAFYYYYYYYLSLASLFFKLMFMFATPARTLFDILNPLYSQPLLLYVNITVINTLLKEQRILHVRLILCEHHHRYWKKCSTVVSKIDE